jgi:hypothetical protein
MPLSPISWRSVSGNQRSTRRQPPTWSNSLTNFKLYHIMMTKGLTMIYKTSHTHKKKETVISREWRKDGIVITTSKTHPRPIVTQLFRNR